jgi:hypothetical protein
MNDQTAFVIDSNILIQAHRQYYSFAICPGFWESILHHHQCTKVFSIDRVKEEITGKDELALWVRDTAPKSFFCSTNEVPIIGNFAEIMQWVESNQQFTDGAKEEFAKVADGWLVAYACAKGLTLVTHEEIRPNSKFRVPIPNICRQFGVNHLNTFDMLKHLQTRFHWNRP